MPEAESLGNVHEMFFCGGYEKEISMPLPERKTLP